MNYLILFALGYLIWRLHTMTEQLSSLDAVTSRIAASVGGIATRFEALAAKVGEDDSAAIEADVARLRAAADALDAIGTGEQTEAPPAVVAAAEKVGSEPTPGEQVD